MYASQVRETGPSEENILYENEEIEKLQPNMALTDKNDVGTSRRSSPMHLSIENNEFLYNLVELEAVAANNDKVEK